MPGLLQHSPQRIIGAICVNCKYGTDPDTNENGAWPVFDGRQPDAPDSLIKITGTRGRADGFTQVDKERQEWYGIQVLVRGVVDWIVWQKTIQLATALDRLVEYPITLPDPDTGYPDTGTGTGTGTGPLSPRPGASHYIVAGILRTTEPIFIGRDTPEGKRVQYTFNALCSIRQCF